MCEYLAYSHRFGIIEGMKYPNTQKNLMKFFFLVVGIFFVFAEDIYAITTRTASVNEKAKP